MVDWVSLTIPLAYSVILVGSLAAFSWVYRRRQALHAASLEPWFGQHLQRDIYYSLWNMNDGSGTKVPESVLKAALLRRAAEDVGRIIQMRQGKQALSSLLARGSVGDDLWQRFQRAEKELEAELQDVVSEANALSPNWGQVIFQSANEMAANARLRKRLDEIEDSKGPEHEWWEKKQATMRDEFMKELDETEGTKGGSGNTSTAAAAAAAEGSTPGSEDGVVVVDAAAADAADDDDNSSDGNTGPNTPTTSGSAEGGSRKKNKKKGKK